MMREKKSVWKVLICVRIPLILRALPCFFCIHPALKCMSSKFLLFYMTWTSMLISNRDSIMHISYINNSMILIQYSVICKCPLSLIQLPLKTMQKVVFLFFFPFSFSLWNLDHPSLNQFRLTFHFLYEPVYDQQLLDFVLYSSDTYYWKFTTKILGQ